MELRAFLHANIVEISKSKDCQYLVSIVEGKFVKEKKKYESQKKDLVIDINATLSIYRPKDA